MKSQSCLSARSATDAPELWFAVLLCCGLVLPSLAQDRLKSMPRYERYQKLSKEIPSSVKSGALSVTWTNKGSGFSFSREGKRYHYDIPTHQLAEIPARTNQSRGATNSQPAPREQRPPKPERGRQYIFAMSPDGQWKAAHRERNLWLSSTNSTNAFALTTTGSEKTRLKFGTANWVYGEELYQTTAIWWSTNSRKVAFYRFDESPVRDYYLTLDETRSQNRLDVEPYMKAGTTNPLVDILIYDLESRKTVTVDVRSGLPFDNSVLGHYVYGVSWTPDSKELLFHRTNRRQNIMEFCAADPETGRVRVVVREEWLPSWTENLPPKRWLNDGKRFLWISERTGWRNLYLGNLSGAPLMPITRHNFEVGEVVSVDETLGRVFYTARSGDNPLKLQLHSVALDGTGDRRLTDPALHHTVDVAPDHRHFIDVAQTHDIPPVTRLMDAEGRCVTELARSDASSFKKLGLRAVELLQFKAADGRTDLYGMLHFPSDFQPYKKYPLLISVYAGPATVGARETFTLPNALTELGFLVATLDSRSASGRGKLFLDAIYQKLGTVEVDDQASGVRSLASRRYVNLSRVGIFGTSYGGSVSAMAMLRHPDVFQAACANSAVTDYRNYDTIYTERYMWLPQENKAGYDTASVMNHATNLHGRLLLFYGTADNNVHPANTLQFIAALQKAGKSFELQVGPDLGHTSVNRDRMMEFFVENLILQKPAPYKKPASDARSAGRLPPASR